MASTICRATALLLLAVASVDATRRADPNSIEWLRDAAGNTGRHSRCKVIPGDQNWPSESLWQVFNDTVEGKLVATKPVAISCYPGPDYNAAACAAVDAKWSDARFQSNQAVGLSYPTEITCPPINATAGEVPNGPCTLGVSPIFAVDCSDPVHIATAVTMANLFNIRLVIKSTGHDLLGRSEGANGLEIWLRNYRNGIYFQKSFKSAAGCKQSAWTGNALKIAGSYTWGEVYAQAKAKNVIVVGGSTPSVGANGGWMSGGGHGPASRQFGLGADQVLEMDVVLANGTHVTVNACQNADLFFALRGGGGGTYGIVVESTIKAHPMTSVIVQHLAIGALGPDTSGLLDAIAIMYSAFPDLNDAGYAGYGQWTIASPVPLFGEFTAGYVHSTYMFGKTQKEAEAAFDQTRAMLSFYNMSSVFISETYVSYPDYWSFYEAESGVESPVGSPSILGSRLFDRSSVTKDFGALRNMIEITAGTPDAPTVSNFEIVSGGQVFQDKADPTSGVLPAWRTSHFNNIVAVETPKGATADQLEAIRNDVTYIKTKAMNDLAPNTGAYMNEADRFDPNYKTNFYGSNYDRFLAVKRKYDPSCVFYCPTCVGSDAFQQCPDGRLCRV